MKFADPYILNCLWLLILVAAILAYGQVQRKKAVASFCDAQMLKVLLPGFDQKRRWIKLVLIILAMALAIVAMAGPQFGFKWEKVKQKGVDIMIALDCSNSMLAQDIQPNRLERAKREIIDLLKMMKSDRAGLVAFSGSAVLQCPLTLDHDAFHIFLDVLEPGFLPQGGTSLDAAIQISLQGFDSKSDTQKAIILITDGENTSGSVEKSVEMLAEQGIKLFCIGVGGVEGAPIPDEKGGFKKDQSGAIVMSKVDEKGLEKLAAMTQGAYVRSVAGDMDLDLIYTDHILGTMERKTLVSGNRKVWENRFQWFLFPCLILLLIEVWVSPARKHLKRTTIVLLAVCMMWGIPDQAIGKSVFSSVKQGIESYEKSNFEQAKKHFIDAQLEDPDTAQLYYNIGTAAFMNKEYELAKKNFEQAALSEDKNLRQNALYNLANTHYKMGNFDEAIAGYEQVLKEFSDDNQAKENLEFVRKKKKEQEQKPPEKQEQKNSDSQKEQDKNQDKEKGNQQGQPGQNKPNQKESDQKESEQKKENSDPKPKPENQNKKDQTASDSKQSDKKESGEPPPPKPANQTEPSQANQVKQSPDDAQKQAVERMLNRLEDKPGKAMIPVLQERHVEKDW